MLESSPININSTSTTEERRNIYRSDHSTIGRADNDLITVMELAIDKNNVDGTAETFDHLDFEHLERESGERAKCAKWLPCTEGSASMRASVPCASARCGRACGGDQEFPRQ